MNEANEAAERLKDHESGGDPYPFDGGARQMCDTETIARWALPLLDATPVTADWLRSVGFRQDDERPYHWINNTFTKFDLVAWDDGDWELANADNSIPLVPRINTRGAVRMLCISLSIQLTEPPSRVCG